MKNTIQKLTLIVAISLTFLVGCTEFFDKIDDFNVGVTNTIFEQSAVIELQDYFGDQQNIIDTNLKVEFSGTDADKLVNEAGEFTISETDGFIQLNVNPNKSTGVKELNFDVTVSGGNYRTATFPVILTDTVSLIQLSLLDESKIRTKTDEVNTDVSLTNNEVLASVTIKTTAIESLNATTVTVNTGTGFKDATGIAITGNDLKINVKNTDQLSDLMIESEYSVFKDENGVEISNKTPDFIFGKTQISMDVNGTVVKEFTNEIEVAIKISSETTNPITGTTVEVGDTFPIYTNDEETTEWTYHGIGNVKLGDSANNFDISFKTSHLSNYAVVNFVDDNDFKACYINNKAKATITAPNLDSNFTSTYKIKLLITTSHRGDQVIEELIVLFNVDIVNGKIEKIDEPINPFFSSSTWNFLKYPLKNPWFRNMSVIDSLLKSGKDVLKIESSDFFEISTEYQLFVTWYDFPIRTNLSSIATFANCELNINLTQDGTDYFNIGNLKNIAIDVAANCNNKTFVPDGFPFYVERENGIFSYEGTIKEGKMTLKGFELGKEYNFKTVYKGQSYFHKWTFDSETFTDKNFEVPQSACDALNI